MLRLYMAIFVWPYFYMIMNSWQETILNISDRYYLYKAFLTDQVTWKDLSIESFLVTYNKILIIIP